MPYSVTPSYNQEFNARSDQHLKRSRLFWKLAMNTRAKKKGYYSSEKENSSFQQLKTYGVRTETGRGCPSLSKNGDVSRISPLFLCLKPAENGNKL